MLLKLTLEMENLAYLLILPSLIINTINTIMMKYFSLLFLLISICISCTPKKTARIEKTPEQVEEVVVVEEVPRVEEVFEEPEVVVIEHEAVELIASIKKTPCFGKCPVFEIKLFSDGVVNYIGKKYVDKLGVFEASISVEEAKMLIADIANLGYFSLEENYPNNGQKISDLPNTITFVKNKTESHTITNNHQAPQSLNQIENLLLQKLEVLEYDSIEVGEK